MLLTQCPINTLLYGSRSQLVSAALCIPDSWGTVEKFSDLCPLSKEDNLCAGVQGLAELLLPEDFGARMCCRALEEEVVWKGVVRLGRPVDGEAG